MQAPNFSTIIKNKSIISGIAMIAILLCHFNTVSVAWKEWLRYLTPGFIGVDIFLFFSGWSLCYSWKNNKFTEFYHRRIKRIFPLYVVFAVTVTILFILLRGDKYTLFDWVCNIMTLNYWGIGGGYIDWYLPAILFFYALFPLLFYYIDKTKLIGLVFILLVTGLIVYLTDLHWRFDAAIARIPVFCLGILFFVDKNDNKKIGVWGCLLLFLTSLAIILFKIDLPGVFLTNCIAGSLILLLSWVLPLFKSTVIKCLAFVGNNSLEIYVGHIISCWILELISVNQITISVLYLILNVVFSVIMIQINRGLSKLFVK